MNIGRIGLLVACTSLLVSGCKKSDEFSDVPLITFKSLTVGKDASGFDEVSHLIISFKDGDGDIGTERYDGVPNNFIIKRFEKKNGAWIADTINLNGHLPYLTPEGSNKALKGEIATDIQLPFVPPRTNDTIQYLVYIYDRALHQSNSIYTSEIVINTR